MSTENSTESNSSAGSVNDLGPNLFSVTGAATFILSIVGLLVLGLTESWSMGLATLGAVVAFGWLLTVLLGLFSRDEEVRALPFWNRLATVSLHFVVGYFFVLVALVYLIGSAA